MDLSTWVVLGLAALIGANHVLVRLPWVRSNDALFWLLNLLDLGVGIAVLALGLPGYAHAPAVGWVVGLLLVLHVAQNLHLRGQWARETREAAQRQRDRERRRRRQEREARGMEGSDGPDGPGAGRRHPDGPGAGRR